MPRTSSPTQRVVRKRDAYICICAPHQREISSVWRFPDCRSLCRGVTWRRSSGPENALQRRRCGICSSCCCSSRFITVNFMTVLLLLPCISSHLRSKLVLLISMMRCLSTRALGLHLVNSTTSARDHMSELAQASSQGVNNVFCRSFDTSSSPPSHRRGWKLAKCLPAPGSRLAERQSNQVINRLPQPPVINFYCPVPGRLEP